MSQVRVMNAWVWPLSSWCVSPVDTQVVSIIPPGHPCLFPFSFFSSFFLCLLPFPVFRFLFVLSFSVCFLYRLIRFYFRFPALLGGWLCYFVSVLRTPPLRCLRAYMPAYSPCVLLAFLAFVICIVILFFLSCFPFFSVSIWTSFVSSCLVLVGIIYSVSSVSISSVFVIHIKKPVFLPIDIQHTQCPCRFFLLGRYELCGHKTTTQRYHIVMQ